MKQSTRDILYKIDRAARYVLGVFILLFFIILCLAEFSQLPKQSVRYSFWIMIIAIIICAIVRFVLSPFVKSDEEEEFEQKIDYILQQKAEKKIEPKIELPPANYSPLYGINPRQKEQIHQLLRELPENPKKPGYIKLSTLAQYLTALEKMKIAKLTDKYNLRLWAAQVTGKKMPDTSQFNEAIPSKMSPKVAIAREKLEQIIR